MRFFILYGFEEYRKRAAFLFNVTSREGAIIRHTCTGVFNLPGFQTEGMNSL